jgi:hypothetical protein
MATSSVPEWLDNIGAGFGGKFSSCFEDIGVETVADVPKYIGDKEFVELTESLRTAGGKGVHIAKIEAAIADLKGTDGSTMVPHRPNVPARSASNPRTNAHSSAPAPTGKRYACFLSHHKADCAMEARFLKNQLQDMLGAEVFLDSDGTFRPALFSQLARVFTPLTVFSLVCRRLADLRDLTGLLGHVRNSKALVLVQSASVLQRPW